MIHLLQSANKKVFQGICLNILSIMKHTKEPVHLHLMTIEISWSEEPKISEEQANHLREVMKCFNPENELTYYDVSEAFEKTFKDTPNQNPKYTPASLIRLLFTQFIDCDKLIYLDTDTMTCASLEEFKKIDIENAEMAVCLDYLGQFWLKSDYFNSGVLYINVQKVKETKLFENTLELLRQKHFYFSDQTALYKTANHIVYMPDRFNEQRAIKEDTVIKHFCKGIRYLPFFKVYNYKQWQVNKLHSFFKMHQFDDIFVMYDKYFPDEAKLEY